jgi:hypothetical protein
LRNLAPALELCTFFDMSVVVYDTQGNSQGNNALGWGNGAGASHMHAAKTPTLSHRLQPLLSVACSALLPRTFMTSKIAPLERTRKMCWVKVFGKRCKSSSTFLGGAGAPSGMLHQRPVMLLQPREDLLSFDAGEGTCLH